MAALAHSNQYTYRLIVKKPPDTTACTNHCGHTIYPGQLCVYRPAGKGYPMELLCRRCGEQVRYEISKEAGELLKASRPPDAPFLAVSALKILKLLAERGRMTRAEIGNCTDITPKAVIRQQQKMLEAGLLAREDVNAERVEWYLTEAGKAVAKGSPGLLAPAPAPKLAPVKPAPKAKPALTKPLNGPPGLLRGLMHPRRAGSAVGLIRYWEVTHTVLPPGRQRGDRYRYQITHCKRGFHGTAADATWRVRTFKSTRTTAEGTEFYASLPADLARLITYIGPKRVGFDY